MKTSLIILCLFISEMVLAQDGNAEKGHETYDQWCTPCHGAGAGFLGPQSQLPGTAALQALYKGERPAVLSERNDLTAEYIEIIVRNGRSIMPFFRKTEVSDQDLRNITAYLIKK